MTIYEEIQAEVDLQESVWGGEEFDKHHTINDWVVFICRYATQATMSWKERPEENIPIMREYLIKTAAICVNVLQRLDDGRGVKPRHYDKVE